MHPRLNIFRVIVATALIFLSSCYAQPESFVAQHNLLTPRHEKIPVVWAIKPEDKLKGLGNVAPEQFPKSYGMMFYYPAVAPRSFWMLDTYFDLDIIFLDENMKIIAIEHNMPHSKGKNVTPEIARTGEYASQYVLELHSGVSENLKLKVSDQLVWERPEAVHMFLHND